MSASHCRVRVHAPQVGDGHRYGRTLRLAKRSCDRCGQPSAAMLPWARQQMPVRTTGLLTAGRNRGAQTKTFSGEMMTDKLSLY